MSPNTPSTLIPSLRYRNALTAIDWLCRAFGLAKNAVYADGETVHHAQLTYSGGMIMLGSVDHKSEYGKLTAQPDEIGQRSTGGIYLCVPDADGVYATAKQAGATIVLDIRDMEYGGRGFTCRDLEGHLWSIGSYNPWDEQAPS
jgi:uncharacterized glyoxalase superfamily protein PhnB